jgi:phenylalanyl-tRNA synthetase alpha chain
MRWVPAHFPFTEPSIELEIFWNGQWLEMLGSGVLRREVMDNFGRPSDEIGIINLILFLKL